MSHIHNCQEFASTFLLVLVICYTFLQLHTGGDAFFFDNIEKRLSMFYHLWRQTLQNSKNCKVPSLLLSSFLKPASNLLISNPKFLHANLNC